MRDILLLCPQERDLKAVEAAGLEDRYSIRFQGSDLDQLEFFDPVSFLAECEAAWDAETHMSKETWRDTCRRTLTEPHR